VVAGGTAPAAMTSDRGYGDRLQRLCQARADQFVERRNQLRAEAARLAALPPRREQVRTVGDMDRTVAQRPALPVRFGDRFPLLRFMVGAFQDANDRYGTSASHYFHCNRVVVTAPGGAQVDLVLTVSLQELVLATRLSVTPYCPSEGYQIEDADFDVDSRHDKLVRLSFSPVEEKALSRIFPASSALLAVSLKYARGSGEDAEALRSTALALAFPGGQRYLTADGWDGSSMYCDEFVPADRGFLASSRWISGSVRIFVPPDPYLLKLVWARFQPRPDRRARHRDIDYPGPFHVRTPWPLVAKGVE
jgi:hypothetical protein